MTRLLFSAAFVATLSVSLLGELGGYVGREDERLPGFLMLAKGGMTVGEERVTAQRK